MIRTASSLLLHPLPPTSYPDLWDPVHGLDPSCSPLGLSCTGPVPPPPAHTPPSPPFLFRRLCASTYSISCGTLSRQQPATWARVCLGTWPDHSFVDGPGAGPAPCDPSLADGLGSQRATASSNLQRSTGIGSDPSLHHRFGWPTLGALHEPEPGYINQEGMKVPDQDPPLGFTSVLCVVGV